MNGNDMRNGLFVYQDKDEPQFDEVNYGKIEQKRKYTDIVNFRVFVGVTLRNEENYND